MTALHTDLLVVGAGMSGLVAAATAAEAGARVLLVHAGLGSFVYGAGSISEAPGGAAQTFFQSLAEAAGAPYHEEAQLPTMLGSTQPMALVPDALWGGRALPGSGGGRRRHVVLRQPFRGRTAGAGLCRP